MKEANHLFCVGLNHQTASVEVRERVAFAEKELPDASLEVRSLEGIGEVVVLSTCNRMEIYGAAEDRCAMVERVEEFLRLRFGVEAEPLHLYEHSGSEAARHLFRVASGLDSMVLGETEIFGQVKKAYHAAHEAGATGKRLNKLFQHSFQLGKKVRNSTEIQRGTTSVGSVAVDLAERIFGSLEHCNVLLIGAGDMSRRTAASLQSRGANSIFVSNRSYDRAVELAKELNAAAVRFDDWPQQILSADILISSTAAPHHVILVEHIVPVLRKRRGRPLFLIDIAVPRDIDPAIDALDGVYVYDMDALQMIANDARKRREDQIRKCDSIIQRFLDDNSEYYGAGLPGSASMPPTTESATTGEDRNPLPNT
ncbi:MAG: glutamyl-tRNA reductase [Verrucomicrobiales bacterium]|jgi:glutamyl-tRNA reductase